MVDDPDEVDGMRLTEWVTSLVRAHWLSSATIAAHVMLLVFVPEVWDR